MTPRKTRLLGALLFGVVVASTLLAIRVSVANPANLVHLERIQEISDVDIGPEVVWLAVGMNGDGATFAVVAADPSGSGPGQKLRFPAYRYARPAYPYLSSLSIAGRADLVLYGLAAIGFVAVAGTAIVAHLLNRDRGWFAWLLVLNPALFVGFLENTAEPLAILTLSLALFTGSRLAAGATSLARPSYLLGLAKDWRALAVGLGTALIVKLLWSWRFAESVTSGGFNLDAPFRGVVQSPSLVGWIVVIAGLATLLFGLATRDAGWVLSGLLVVSLSVVVVDTPVNAVRAAGLLPVLWAFGPRFEPRSFKSILSVGGVSYPEG